MCRFRRVFFTLSFALYVVCGGRGYGQAPANASGVVVDFSAPPAIDRGLTRSLSRALDGPEAMIRASIRPEGFTLDRVGRTGAHYIAGKVIVKFRDGTSVTARASTLSAMSIRASSQPSYANFEVMSIDPGQDAEAVAQTFAARPDVEYAQAAYRMYADFKPNDEHYHLQWNLPDIDMERAWDIQPLAGSSVTVAVLDTGIAYKDVTKQYVARAFNCCDSGGNVTSVGVGRYPALGTLTLPFVAATDLGPPSRFVAPHDFIWDSDVPNVPNDLDGHGTHVSGTIGQTTNNNLGTAGVAFNVKLMPVKVIGGPWDEIFGAPNQGTDDIVARGIRYAADNGAKVINMSIGRSSTDPTDKAPVVEAAMRYAVGKGVFIAVASGNEFEDGNPREVIADIAGRVQGAVAVGATDRSQNRAFYSSTGSWVKVSAPGGSFRGFGGEGGILQQTMDLGLVETFTLPPSQFRAPRFDALMFFYFEGTSQATPHVSGLAAMLMQQGITDPAAIESALEKFATPRGGTTGRNNEFGFGEINARNTLRGLGLAR